VPDYRGKVAVVTGAASGIGYAVASRAASEGMTVVLADIDAGRLDGAAASLRRRLERCPFPGVGRSPVHHRGHATGGRWVHDQVMRRAAFHPGLSLGGRQHWSPAPCCRVL